MQQCVNSRDARKHKLAAQHSCCSARTSAVMKTTSMPSLPSAVATLHGAPPVARACMRGRACVGLGLGCACMHACVRGPYAHLRKASTTPLCPYVHEGGMRGVGALVGGSSAASGGLLWALECRLLRCNRCCSLAPTWAVPAGPRSDLRAGSCMGECMRAARPCTCPSMLLAHQTHQTGFRPGPRLSACRSR